MKQLSILILVVLFMAGIAGIGCEKAKAPLPSITGTQAYPPVPGNTPVAVQQENLTAEQIQANQQAEQARQARDAKIAEQIRIAILNAEVQGQCDATKIKSCAKELNLPVKDVLKLYQGK